MNELARKLLETPDAIIVDTETTGLGWTAEIVQLSIIDITGNVIIDQLVRPALATIEEDAAAVHGKTWKMVKNMPTLSHYLPQLDKLRGRTAIAYNAEFDSRMLVQSARANGSAELRDVFMSWNWVCAMEAYAEFWGEYDYHGNYRWQKLATACRQQGIGVVNAHDAMGDARMTLALLAKLAESETQE
jgi:DNA polymerase-3 subunit epsilon